VTVADMTVVPTASSPVRPRHRRAVLVTAAAVLVIAAVVAWTRLPEIARTTVWAEDGRVFLGDQLREGTVGSLSTPYEGYLQLVPRVITDVAVHIAPIRDYAVAMAALSVLVTALAGAAVTVLSGDVVRSWSVRILLGLVPVVAPEATTELLGNAANVHSFLLYLTPWLFVARPRGWTMQAALGVLALVVGLSEIQIVLFLPLLVLRIRSARHWPVVAGALVGAGAQVVTAVVSPRSAPGVGPIPTPDIAVGWLVEPFAQAFTSRSQDVGTLVATTGPWVLLLLFAIVCAVLVVAVRRGTTLHRVMIVAMVWGSGATWFGSLWLNHGTGFDFLSYSDVAWRNLGTVRYAAVSAMFVLAGLLVAADACLRATAGADTPTARRVPRGLGAAVLVVVLAVAVVGFPPTVTTRALGPIWSHEIDAAADTCTSDPARTAVRIATAPHADWNVQVPCAMIDSDR
jgi:hypothetical protein